MAHTKVVPRRSTGEASLIFAREMARQRASMYKVAKPKPEPETESESEYEPSGSSKTKPRATKRKRKVKVHPLKELAKTVNELRPEELQSLLEKHLEAPPSESDKEGTRTWKVYDGPTIKKTPSLKKQLWSLFESNMRDMYIEAKDPHIKWDPPSKEKELFHKLSRFILLEDSTSEELSAFCMVRFEAEKNYEGEMEFLIYIYEIQVSESLRGQGVFRRLLTALERLGAELKVQLIMLTCFRCNTKALPVYEHLGFKEHIDTTETALVFYKSVQ